MPGGSSLAPHACATCRTQKRKCTKEIPQCALCKKNGRPCDYGIFTGNAPTAIDSERTPREIPSTRRGHQLHPSASTSSGSPGASYQRGCPEPAHTDFPAVFFLDSEYFQQKIHTVEKVNLALPPELTGHLGGPQKMLHDVDVYFNSIHSFLPVISKLRLYQELHSSQNNQNADTTLLLMTMQLHTQPNGSMEPSHRHIYKVAKACFSYVQGSSTFSLRLLQAGLLITLYEISNAIFPAAYLSVGHCARLGQAMGIHDRKRAPQMLSALRTSTESEERRRGWWGVTILDRYVNIGIPSSPFATEDARPEEYLPVDDKYWDRGELTSIQPLAISAGTTAQVSPFARTCQAAHLLSRVLRHGRDIDTDAEFRYKEAMQLHITIQAFHSTIWQESEQVVERTSDLTANTPLFTSTALCLSALLSLYYNYSCIEQAGVEQLRSAKFLAMNKVAIEGLKNASSSVYTLAMGVRATAELGGMLKTSPLICECLYQAVSTYLWYMEETSSSEYELIVTSIKDVLEMLAKRWKAPREYLRILESKISVHSQLTAASMR